MKKDFAIAAFGGGAVGVAALADFLGITRHAIYQWRDPIPDYRALQIENELASCALEVRAKPALKVVGVSKRPPARACGG